MLRILIADDEDLARRRLLSLLAQLPDVQVVGEARHGREAVERCQVLHPDLALLDVRMPVMDGIEAARYLAQLPDPPAVIFVTAYDQHALQAFEVNAVDYLVKPLRLERLEASLKRAARQRPEIAERLDALAQQPSDVRTHLCARVRGNLVLVPVLDVIYLQADEKYVQVHHTGGELLIEDSLKGLEDEFGDLFVRVHRNALVARSRIAGLVRGANKETRLALRDSSTTIEVSRRNLPALRALMRHL